MIFYLCTLSFVLKMGMEKFNSILFYFADNISMA